MAPAISEEQRTRRNGRGNLTALMFAAFVDMMGLLMIVPQLPFVATRLGAGGFVVGALISSFSLAQLLSAPLWGRFSDRYGRRPVLLTALTASVAAYLIFAWASLPSGHGHSAGFYLLLLFLSRIVQGAGGGTVGVIQAYVADSTEPRDRARALGWLSAATNLGVSIGPALGSLSLAFYGARAPGVLAAVLCAANIGFVWMFVRESHVPAMQESKVAVVKPAAATLNVLTHPGEPAPRLIWIYAIAMGAFSGFTAVLALFLAVRFGITDKTIGYFFAWNGAISVLVRAFLLGPAVDRFGEARLARIGQALLVLGLGLIPLTATIRTGWPVALPFGVSMEPRIVVFALVIALLPLGTAFTFPCVTGLLSQVIEPRERGVMMGVQQSYGGAARVLFPLLAGWTFQHMGTGYPFWTSAALVLGTFFLSFGIGPRREEDEPAAPEKKEGVAVAAT
ncbi:MFS transporter [Longimicrobium sp.]|uniref:MFS transporter n=1 Tax=Longimicrobium sp. TaxID=2029185 RepID=UPI002CC67205|nr:MFS transporter [Longimicrobium sp.]HSU15644.1 MFS transporter [Longimicrobium sp.]